MGSEETKNNVLANARGRGDSERGIRWSEGGKDRV